MQYGFVINTYLFIIKDNMATMFKPVREVERLEPSSVVSPGLIIQPLEGLFYILFKNCIRVYF